MKLAPQLIKLKKKKNKKQNIKLQETAQKSQKVIVNGHLTVPVNTTLSFYILGNEGNHSRL